MRYTTERKEAVLKKMMPPHPRPINQLPKEEGISEATLYKWRRDARKKSILLPDAERVSWLRGGILKPPVIHADNGGAQNCKRRKFQKMQQVS